MEHDHLGRLCAGLGLGTVRDRRPGRLRRCPLRAAAGGPRRYGGRAGGGGDAGQSAGRPRPVRPRAGCGPAGGDALSRRDRHPVPTRRAGRGGRAAWQGRPVAAARARPVLRRWRALIWRSRNRTVVKLRQRRAVGGLPKYMVALGVLVAILGSGCSGPATSTRPNPGPPPSQANAGSVSLGGANLVSYADSDFETGTGDWAPVANATLTTGTRDSFLHRTSLKDVLQTTGASSFQLSRNWRIGVTAGGQYRVGAYFDVRAASGRSVTFGVQAHDSAGRP